LLPGVPFITFFAAILFATLLGGVTVGLAVLALSFLSSWYFFVPPQWSFRLDGAGALALAMFGVFGGAMIAIERVATRFLNRRFEPNSDLRS